MSCHTASGRQIRGCAELNRSKAIQKRCASCGSKGTFDFCLSFLPGKFPLRILQRTAPSGRQGGQSATLAPLCSVTQRLDRQSDPATPRGPVRVNEPLTITVRRKPSPPDTGAPKVYGRTDGDRCTPRFVTACFLPPGLKPSGCVSGRPWKLNVNVFKPFGFTDGSRKLCAVRSKPFTASLPAPLCYPCPPAAPLNLGQRTPHVCACAYAYVRVRKT